MPLAGMAYGASRGLEEIVQERILRQKLEQEIALQQERQALDARRLAETETQNRYDRARTDRIDTENRETRQRATDKQATAQRGRSNIAGVIGMGLDPATAKREIAVSALNNDVDVPSGVMEAITPPKPERDPIAEYRQRKEIDQEFDKPPTAPRRQVFQVNGKLVDETGKVVFDGGNPNAVDPTKARERGRTMLDAAKSLRNHKGLSNLTGARIGNPDYALGVQDEPVGGSPAADAQAYFNQLKSQFTLDNLGLLKGVLSDSDMKILQQASTSLDTKMQDATFAAELDKVIQELEGAFGGGQAPNLPPMEPTSSRGTGRAAPVDPVDALIAKYGRKP
jgi:hypothetical protein